MHFPWLRLLLSSVSSSFLLNFRCLVYSRKMLNFYLIYILTFKWIVGGLELFS